MLELNREYKDSVFRSIFGTCDEASEYDLALYIALTGDTDVTVDNIKQVQLDNIVTAGMHNDVAFTVKGQMIFLIEHQSTENPNMPLRMLFYFDKELRKLIKLNKVYASGVEAGVFEEKRSNAREMLKEGIPKSTIERIVKMSFDKLGLNDDGTLKNP